MFSTDLSFTRPHERLKPFPVGKTKMRIKQVCIFFVLVAVLVVGVYFSTVRGDSHPETDNFWERNAAFHESWDSSQGEAIHRDAYKDSNPSTGFRVGDLNTENEKVSPDIGRLFPAELLQNVKGVKESEEDGGVNERSLNDFEEEKEEEKQWMDRIKKQQKLIELQKAVLEKLSALQQSQAQRQQQNYDDVHSTRIEDQQMLLKAIAQQQKQSQSEVEGQRAEDPVPSHSIGQRNRSRKSHSISQKVRNWMNQRQSAAHQKTLINLKQSHQRSTAPNIKRITNIPAVAVRPTPGQSYVPQQSRYLNQRVEDYRNEQSAKQQVATLNHAVEPVTILAINQEPKQNREKYTESEKKELLNSSLSGNPYDSVPLAPQGIQSRRKITFSPIHTPHRVRLLRQTTHPPHAGKERKQKFLKEFFHTNSPFKSWGRHKAEEKSHNEMKQGIQKHGPFVEERFEKFKDYFSHGTRRGDELEIKHATNTHDIFPIPGTHTRLDVLRSRARAKVSLYDLGKPVSGDFNCKYLIRPRFSSRICVKRLQSPEGLIPSRSWQEKELEEFEAILEKNSSKGVVDVSAGVGVFTVAAAATKRNVVAVEPDKNNILLFHKTMKENLVTNLVTLIIDNMWDPKYEWHHVTLDDALPVMNFTDAVIRMQIPYPGNQAKVLKGAERIFSTIIVRYVLMSWAPSVQYYECQEAAAFLRRHNMEPVYSVNHPTRIYKDEDLFTDKIFIVWQQRNKPAPERTYDPRGRQ